MPNKKRHKKKKIVKTNVNKNLPGYDIKINPLGEIQSTYDIDAVNIFLNENLEDKKLKNKTKQKVDKDGEEENEGRGDP